MQGAVERENGPELVAFLLRSGKLSETGASQVSCTVQETREPTVAALVKLGFLSEPDMAEALCSYLQLPRAQAAEFPASVVELPEVSHGFLRAQSVVPLSAKGDRLALAEWNPVDDFASRALAFATGLEVDRRVATRTQIESALESLYGDRELDAAARTDAALTVDEEDIERLKDLASNAPVIRLVQKIINEAVAQAASDIHLESTDQGLKVRFRIDGMLRDVEHCPLGLREHVASRLKIMAGLNIAERRLPQDGRIRITVQGRETDFRVATAPTVHGESVVLRILDRQEVALDFATLGFDAALIGKVRATLGRPYGIVLSTGPTGSGKTTTLYTALHELNTPLRKILTVEDPIEYTLAGINQTQVKPQIGYTFASALRSFLRHDPDVLMVGEIRDTETAQIAVQAALTGHLLLSTLHTNSAATAITRLLDMGIDAYLLTSTISLVLGQRLVRQLCTSCREPYAPPAAIRTQFGLSAAQSLDLYRPRGCERCQHSGYHGRTGIVEALELTEPLQRLVLQKADANALEREAVAQGMRTMLQDGLEKAQSGVTTLEEVLRVTRSVGQ